MQHSFYGINGKKVEVISNEKNGIKKVYDIRVALKEEEYKTLRRKRSEQHLSEYESITPLDIQNAYAEFNETVEQIKKYRNSTETNLSSRFYKWRWNLLDMSKLEGIQEFIVKAKAQLLDPLIDFHRLRNNPLAVFTPNELAAINFDTDNISKKILEKLKIKIDALKDKVNQVSANDLGITNEELKILQDNIEARCMAFNEKITTLIEKPPIESDVKKLFQNNQLGRFIETCSFDLIDGIDKLVRAKDGNGYWDLRDLHPARKVFSRVKRKMNARAQYAGGQTISERPVPQETLNSLIDETNSTPVSPKNQKEFWVSIKPYVDHDFSLGDVAEVLNIVSSQEIDVAKGWRNAAIFILSFIWEPIPIVARFVVGVVLTPFSVVSSLLEKTFSFIGFKTGRNFFKSLREDVIEGAHKEFGKLAESFSLTSRLKKERNDQSVELNKGKNNVDIVDGNGLPIALWSPENLSHFIQDINLPVNQMHILAEQYFSPSKWGASLAGIVTSVLSAPARLFTELKENSWLGEKPEDVFKRIKNKTNDEIKADLNKLQTEIQGPPKSNPGQGQSDLETLCLSIKETADTIQRAQTTNVQSFLEMGHNVVRVLGKNFVNDLLCESSGLTAGSAGLSAVTFGLALFFPLIASVPGLSAALHQLQVMPNFLGTNVMGQGLDEGDAAKLFGAFLQYKAIALTGDGIKAASDGDWGLFKKIFNNPEKLAFGFICCTAVGVGLGNAPLIKLPFWGNVTGIHGLQGPYGATWDLFAKEAHDANHAALGADIIPYSFLGLKSLMLLEGLLEGKEHKKHYENVVEKFFKTWDKKTFNNSSVTLEEIFETTEGKAFAKFWENQTAQNQTDLMKTLTDIKTAALNGNTTSVAELSTRFFTPPTPAVAVTELQKAYNDLKEALDWVATTSGSDALNFENNKIFFNGDAAKFYDHLHHLFEKYNQEAIKAKRYDLRIDGKPFLKDFYTKYCYKGSYNFIRSAVWLGNFLLITPMYRRLKYVVMQHSPAMQEQFQRSRAKDIYLAQEFVATTEIVLHAAQRLLGLIGVGVVAIVALPLSALRAMWSRKEIKPAMKETANALTDNSKLHYLSFPGKKGGAEIANTAETTQDLSETLRATRAELLRKNVAVFNTQAPSTEAEHLANKVEKLSKSKKAQTIEILERLTQEEKEMSVSAPSASASQAVAAVVSNPLTQSSVKSAPLLAHSAKQTGLFQKLPRSIQEDAKAVFTPSVS